MNTRHQVLMDEHRATFIIRESCVSLPSTDFDLDGDATQP